MNSIISVTNCSLLLHLLVLLSPWSFASFIAEASAAVNVSAARLKSPFKIIFDGGSTGSRLHIFEFVEVYDEDENDRENTVDNRNSNIRNNAPTNGLPKSQNKIINKSPSTKIECVRRGSLRADIPMSSFGRSPLDKKPLNPETVAAHLLPLFEYAANIIPSEHHDTTGVFYQATAGMRLLEESEQEAVYDAVYAGLMRDKSFVFRGLQRKDISTLSGEMEAYYGALAANFLQGIIDTELRVISAYNTNDNEEETEPPRHPVGALDMGGSSTQIVYIANLEDEAGESATPGSMTCPIKQQSLNNGSADPSQNTCRLSDEHFFSTSYLSYGVDQIRKRLWETLLTEHIESETEDICDAKVISNPCANKGLEVEYNGYTLLGTGNTEECGRQMKRLIPHPDTVHEWDAEVDEWTVGGVEHPPIRGKFLAMSLYFFSLDSLRVFSEPNEKAHTALNAAWPNPSIEELQNALDGLCSRDWQDDMELQEGVHSFTRKEVLPHRCLETVYLVTLLKDGFGFHPSSRDITFTFLIDGDEVEWTLGMALAMNADEQATASATTVTTTSYDYNINETGNNVLAEIQEYLLHRVPNTQLFSVTSPPTHCC